MRKNLFSLKMWFLFLNSECSCGVSIACFVVWMFRNIFDKFALIFLIILWAEIRFHFCCLFIYSIVARWYEGDCTCIKGCWEIVYFRVLQNIFWTYVGFSVFFRNKIKFHFYLSILHVAVVVSIACFVFWMF